MHKFLPALEDMRIAGHSRPKELMDLLRKSSGQFYAELDPERDDRKLGFVDAFSIAEFTKNYDAIIKACGVIGLTVTITTAIPDKATVQEECADDLGSLYEMQRAISEKRSAVEVQTLACRACDEIQQTVVRYVEAKEKGVSA